MAALIKYRFNEVSDRGGGDVGAFLQKIPDLAIPFIESGVTVWESEKGCKEILGWAKAENPQTRKSAYIIGEMNKALRAIGAHKRKRLTYTICCHNCGRSQEMSNPDPGRIVQEARAFRNFLDMYVNIFLSDVSTSTHTSCRNSECGKSITVGWIYK